MDSKSSNKINKTKPISSTIKTPTGRREALSRSSSVSGLDISAKSEADDTTVSNADEFCIGERVWVNGTKPGHIQYIGETQFAPGVWVGVRLDDALGKNDGSVGGVRYFDCEPLRGIFARPHRLKKEAFSSPKAEDFAPLPTPQSQIRVRSQFLTSTDLPGTGHSESVHGSQLLISPKIKIGDKVVVHATSGVKSGILRYVGETEFAPGEWAGIELDEPLGKNDGSVAGKRYFSCKMKYGLFAPLYKVSHCDGSASFQRTPPKTSSLHHRSNSRESLNSSVSSSSFARSGRVKLGVTSLTNTQKSSQCAASAVTATNSALQEALKEKEEHIEQLLKERDIERAEVARAASQVDEVEQKLSELQLEHQRCIENSEQQITHMKELLKISDVEKETFAQKLEEEKRKVEDLQFRLEEEMIGKGDLELQIVQDNEKMKILKEKTQQIEKIDHSAKDSECLSQVLKEKESFENELKTKISVLEITLGEKEKLLCDIQLKSNKLEAHVSGVNQDNESYKNLMLEQISKLKLECEERETENRQIIMELEQEHKNVLLSLQQQLDLQNEKDKTIGTLQENLKNMQGQYQQIHSELKESEKENESMKNHITEIQGTFSEFVKTKDELSEMLKQKEKNNLELLQEHDKILKSLKEQKDLQCEKERLLVEVQESVQNKDRQLKNIYSELKETEEKILLFEKQSSDAGEAIAKLCEINKEKDDTLKKSEEINLELAKQHESTLLTLKQNIDLQKNSEILLSTLQESLEDKEKELQKLFCKLKESEEKANLFEKQCSDSKESLALLLHSKEENNEILVGKEKAIQDLKQKLEFMSVMIKEKENTEQKLKNESIDLNTTLEEKEKLVQELQSQVLRLESCISNVNNDSLSYKTVIDGEMSRLKSYWEEIDLKNRERISQLTRENEEILVSLKQHLEVKSENEICIADLKENLKNSEEQLKRLRCDLQKSEETGLLFEKQILNSEEALMKLSQVKNEQEEILQQKEMRISELSEKLEISVQAMKDQMNSQNQKESLISALQETLQSKEQHLVELCAELKESKAKNISVEKEHSDLKIDLQKFLHLKEELENILQQKEEENMKLSSLADDNGITLQKHTEDISTLKSLLQERDLELKQAYLQIDENQDKLLSLSERKAVDHNELDAKIKNLQEHCDQLNADKNELAEQLRTSLAIQRNFENERDLHMQDVLKKDAVISDSEMKLNTAQAEFNRMEAESLHEKSRLQEKLQKSEADVQTLKIFQIQLETERELTGGLQMELHSAKTQELELRDDIKNLKFEIEGKALLEKKISDLEIINENLEIRKINVEEQCMTLEKLVETNQDLLQHKESELKQLEKKIEELEISNKELFLRSMDLENRNKSFEKMNINNENLLQQDKKEQQQESQIHIDETKTEDKYIEKEKVILDSLTHRYQDSQDSSISGHLYEIYQDPLVESDGKDALLSQVDFLNSIIVDMQKKNEELLSRIGILESVPSLPEIDFNLHGMKPMTAPRLFCDICDMFDIHDTDDCPKQCSFEEEISHSKYHGNRHEERAYCNSCEVFGHWTKDCDDQETF